MELDWNSTILKPILLKTISSNYKKLKHPNNYNHLINNYKDKPFKFLYQEDKDLSNSYVLEFFKMPETTINLNIIQTLNLKLTYPKFIPNIQTALPHKPVEPTIDQFY